MKRRLVVLMAALMMMVTSAIAESASMDLLAQMDGQVFEFSSGVGAWSTELTVGENGTFTGSFHDSEMGETGENYPDGTLYGCSFHGQFSGNSLIRSPLTNTPGPLSFLWNRMKVRFRKPLRMVSVM